jgi:hypothetical protein
VPILAAPNPNWRFVAWTYENGEYYSREQNYVFYIDATTPTETLLAQFSQRNDIVTVQLESDFQGIKSTTGSGIYQKGQSVTVRATVDTGYRFVGWQRRDPVYGLITVSTSPNFTFTVRQDTTLNAAAEAIVFSTRLSVKAEPEGAGSASGTGIYPPNARANIVATPNQGWYFDHWGDNSGVQVSCDSAMSFKTSASQQYLTLTAYFVRPQIKIVTRTVPKDSGLVSGGGRYGIGTLATIQAFPNDNQVFEGWLETNNAPVYFLANSTSYKLPANEDHTFYAYFAPKYVNVVLNAQPTEGGTMSGAGTFPYNKDIIINAKPNAGWRLLYWTNSEGQNVGQNEGQLLRMRYHQNWTAHFGRINTDPSVTLGGINKYGSSGPIDYLNDIPTAIKSMPDGGYLVTAIVQQQSGDVTGFRGGGDGWLLRLNADKTIRWKKCLGGSGDDEISALALTKDGGCIAAGNTRSTDGQLSGNTENKTAWLIKLDSLGNMQWSKNYGIPTNREQFDAVAQLPDGSFVAVGVIYNGDETSLLIHVSATGEMLWSKIVTGRFKSIGITADNNIAIGGYEFNNNRSWKVIKLNQEGGIIWNKDVLQSNSTDHTAITTTAEGGIVIVGDTNRDDDYASIGRFGLSEGYIAKLSASGDKLWGRFIGTPFHEGFTSVTSTPDGGVIAAGTQYRTVNNVDYGKDVWVVKVSALGVIEWEKSVDGPVENEESIDVCVNASGQPTVLARREPRGNFLLPYNVWLISLNATPTAIFTVAASSEQPTLGTVSGGGTFNLNAAAVLKAQYTEGVRFEGWKENGVIVSTSPSYAFTVASNRTIKAFFSKNTLEVLLTKNVVNGGSTVVGGNFYAPNAPVVASAIPARNWGFINWTEDGYPVSDSLNYRFIVTENRQLQANFELRQYDLALKTSHTEGGSATGSGTFNLNSNITIKANSFYGWRFVEWTENGSSVSRDSVYTFRLTQNRVLQANFQRSISNIPPAMAWQRPMGTIRNDRLIGARPLSNGGYMVVGQRDSIDIVNYYNASDTLWLRRTNALGVVQSSQSLGAVKYLRSNATYPQDIEPINLGGKYFETTKDKGFITLTTAYLQIPDCVWVTNNIQLTKYDSLGVVQWQKGYGGAGEEEAFAVHETPDGGYIFTAMTMSNECDVRPSVKTDSTVSTAESLGQYIWVVKLSANGTIQWQKKYGRLENDFRIIDYSPKDVVVLPTGGYAVLGNAARASDSRNSHTYEELYVFRIDDQGNTIWRYQTTLGSKGYARGMVALSDGSLIVSAETNATTLPYPSETPTKGGSDAFVFKLNTIGEAVWQKGYGTSGNDAAGDIRLSSDGYVLFSGRWAEGVNSKAWVQKIGTDGTLIWSKLMGGTATNEAKTIEETADGGYIVGCETTSTNGDVSGNIGAKDVWLVKLAGTTNSVQLNLISNAAAGGTTTGGGIFAQASLVTATATPSVNWRFIAWIDGVDTVAKTAIYSFTLSKNRNLTAIFEANPVLITVNINNSIGGQITGGGLYKVGSIATLRATPNRGFYFVGWLEGRDTVSTEREYAFTAQKARQITALFSKKLPAFVVVGLPQRVEPTRRDSFTRQSIDIEKTISVKTRPSIFFAQISPNPTSGDIELSLNNPTIGRGKIIVFDILGKPSFAQELGIVEKGATAYRLHLPDNTAQGIYLMQIIVDEQMVIKRLVVK